MGNKKVEIAADENGTVSIFVEREKAGGVGFETFTIGSDFNDSVDSRKDGVMLSGLEPEETVEVKVENC